MPLPRAVPRRTRRPLRGAGALLIGCLLLSGCLESGPEAKPAARPTPIAKLDAAHLVVPRIGFCDLVGTGAVEDALGAEPVESQEWGNGDPARGTVGEGGPKAGQELGCSWTSADGVNARAWVFARPVTAAFARTIVGQKPRDVVCTSKPGPPFGKPSQLQECKLGGGVLRVRRAGLFGDAWLSCEIAAPATRPERLRARADAWCVQVVSALDQAAAAR